MPRDEDAKAYFRLTAAEEARVVAWAARHAAKHPPLLGRFFRPDHRPKLGTIVRYLTMDRVSQDKED